VVEPYPRREGGGTLRTQYLEIPDDGAFALVGSRPTWLWGFEHGVNEHRVAIGNEAVYTTVRPSKEPDGLIGMDLVRLGLERGRTARDAIDVMTDLLGRHGQSGPCYKRGGAYHSSFLVCDPTEIWVLETAGTEWATERSTAAAISNRISIPNFDAWRNPKVDTGFADVRLAASRACIARGSSALGPPDMTAHLRDHGSGGGGMPAKDEVSICMHVPEVSATTAAMVCELPEDPAIPMRAWAALGSPCVSVFVPFDPAGDVPNVLSDEATWHRFAGLRDRVELDPSKLDEIRDVLRPLEEELWSGSPADVGARIADALDQLSQRTA
jgi:dipeptidase